MCATTRYWDQRIVANNTSILTVISEEFNTYIEECRELKFKRVFGKDTHMILQNLEANLQNLKVKLIEKLEKLNVK